MRHEKITFVISRVFIAMAARRARSSTVGAVSDGFMFVNPIVVLYELLRRLTKQGLMGLCISGSSSEAGHQSCRLDPLQNHVSAQISIVSCFFGDRSCGVYIDYDLYHKHHNFCYTRRTRPQGHQDPWQNDILQGDSRCHIDAGARLRRHRFLWRFRPHYPCFRAGLHGRHPSLHDLLRDVSDIVCVPMDLYRWAIFEFDGYFATMSQCPWRVPRSFGH